MIRESAKGLFGDLDSAAMPTGATVVAAGRRIPVLLPVALDQTYDYLIADGTAVEAGQFVLVPFGRQQRLGVVWDRKIDDGKPIDERKLKVVIEVLDVPPLPAISLRFAEWVARYTVSPLGMVVRLMMGASQAFEPPPPRFGVRLAGPPSGRMTPGRQRVIDLARDGLIRAKSALAAEAGVSASVVEGLVQSGTLVSVEIPHKRLVAPDPDVAANQLNDDQAQAAASLKSAIDANRFSATLLDGVTGSGKTDVYFEAIAAALKCGRQVLVMLPEIALTSQFADRFRARFGVEPLQWHSEVGGAERGRIWRALATGEARAVIGARSALYLPFRELGLIIVDEEHDTAFKQEDRVSYQGRDMAVVRASLGNLPIVLASATPSIESHWNVKSGRYRAVHLRTRYSGNELPDVTAIDMKIDPPDRGRWLAPRLVAAVAETMARGEQSLLFLNRRGYAPLTLCRSCGHRFQCPQCSAWLVEHRFKNRLDCHHCGFSLPLPEKCPACKQEGTLVPCGPGIERVAEEVRERFPAARLAIFSSDLTPGLGEMRELLASIARGEADIIIGTQIVAKGHNFPNLTLVGIVDGDLGLGQADPRASERTFQLLHQVTGRAGRAEKPGRGLVQTYLREHPVMQAIVAGDRDAFVEHEIVLRQQAMMPPFGRLVSMIVTAKDKTAAATFARDVVGCSPPAERIEVLGPAEAPLAVIRGRHRYRILLKAPREIDVQSYLGEWLQRLPKVTGDLRLQVDVDPYNFL